MKEFVSSNLIDVVENTGLNALNGLDWFLHLSNLLSWHYLISIARSRYASQSYGYASIYDDDNPTEATNLSEKLLGEAMDRYEPALIREYCDDLVNIMISTGNKKIFVSKLSDMKSVLEVDLENILPMDR